MRVVKVELSLAGYRVALLSLPEEEKTFIKTYYPFYSVRTKRLYAKYFKRQ